MDLVANLLIIWNKDAKQDCRLFAASKSLTEGSWIISGIILIWSVNRIRTVINSRQANENTLNIKTLTVHSSAFALYVIAVTVNLV